MVAKPCVRPVVLSLALVLGATPAAFAQKGAFVDALVAFHSALFGTYGDEGPDVTAALERLSSSLDGWDQSTHPAEARRFDAAIAATRDAIAAAPSRSDPWLYLGGLYEEVGRRADAAAAFASARRLNPSDPAAAYLVGLHASENANAGGGDASEALQPLLATVMQALDGPGLASKAPLPQFGLVDDLSAGTRVFAPVAYERGFALLLQGRFRDALEAFRASAARDPLIADPAGRSEPFRRGVAALRQRRGAPAVEGLETAVRDFPASAEAHRVLGIVYRATGRLPESIVHFEAAVRLAPGDERARVGLGGALLEAGRVDDAGRALRDAIARLPASGDARWALADVYELQNRGDEAIRVLEDSTSLVVIAGKAHLYWRIAQLAHALHRDNTRVIDVLTRRMRLVPNEPHAHKDLGLAYSRAGRDDEALLELLMARLLGHEDAETLTATGQIHLNQHRLDRAEGDLRRAVALDPAFAQARYALGRALQRLGRADEAAEQLQAFDRLRAAALEEQRLKYEREAGAPRQ